MTTLLPVTELRRPFAPEAVGFRADAKEPDRSGNVRCVVYIDARLARERLSDVDPNWTMAEPVFLAPGVGDPLGLQCYLPVRQQLTVCGVTRHGVGQAPRNTASGNIVKAAVSDAFKRAAVEFHVAAYLYALKEFKVSADDCWIAGGKVKALNRSGVVKLRKQYADLIAHKLFVERFGAPTKDGAHVDDERGTDILIYDDVDPAATPKPVPSHARTRANNKGTK